MESQSKTSLLALFFLILAGCSEAPTQPVAGKPKEMEKPPEAVTGRWAFHQMFAAARGWALDCQPLRLRSIQLSEVKAGPGKAGAWEATFVSQAKQKARMYTYSVIQSEGNLRKGVFAGLDESYSGPRGQAKPFLVAALKTDTNEVYETALKKAADYVKKNPDMTIQFLLESTSRFPNPAWRVIWGDSIARSNFSILVDASTGAYLETLR